MSHLLKNCMTQWLQLLVKQYNINEPHWRCLCNYMQNINNILHLQLWIELPMREISKWFILRSKVKTLTLLGIQASMLIAKERIVIVCQISRLVIVKTEHNNYWRCLLCSLLSRKVEVDQHQWVLSLKQLRSSSNNFIHSHAVYRRQIHIY